MAKKARGFGAVFCCLVFIVALSGCGFLTGFKDGASGNPPSPPPPSVSVPSPTIINNIPPAQAPAAPTPAPAQENKSSNLLYALGYGLGAAGILAVTVLTKGAINSGVVKNLTDQLAQSVPAASHDAALAKIPEVAEPAEVVKATG